MRFAILRRESPNPLHSLVAPYVLDALDDAERERFGRHLVTCASCQEEVRGFEAVAAALAETAVLVPPAGLRGRVLAAVSDTRKLSVHAHARPARRGLRKTSPASHSSRLLRPALAVGAAGLAASVVLGGIAASARNGQSAAQARTQAITAVLSAPDARLLSAPTSAGGSATVIASVRQGKMVFTSSGLRPLPGSHVYQLWFMGRTTRSAGLVLPTAKGRTAPVIASGLAAGDRIGVTVEPTHGSTTPTTAPIVVLTLNT